MRLSTTGSTYQVIFKHIKAVQPDAQDETGVVVSNAVPGTLIQISYAAKLPRIDRLALNEQGEFFWFSREPRLATASLRISARARPIFPAPCCPSPACRATRGSRADVDNRAPGHQRRRACGAHAGHCGHQWAHGYGAGRSGWLAENMAQQRLTADINLRESSAKKGIFVDPFFNDGMRDQGIEQQAAIVDGELTLPVASVDVRQMGPEGKPRYLAHTVAVALEQPMRTGSMRVNPYSAFEPIPAEIILNPAVDRWTETQTQWASAITKRFTTGSGAVSRTSSSTTAQQLGSTNQQLEFLRQIVVEYDIKGFGPKERIIAFSFDGLAVSPSKDEADAAGRVQGSFTIPAQIPAGAKSVEVVGSGGSRGMAVFVGQGTLTIRTLQQVTSITTQWYDPLAQTFSLPTSMPLAGMDLWFTARGTSTIVVQIRETSIGMPTQTVLAMARLAPGREPRRAPTCNSTPCPPWVLFDAPVTFSDSRLASRRAPNTSS